MSDLLTADTILIAGHGGDDIEAYHAHPLTQSRRGGVVVIHHMPGYDRATKEITRRFAELGYDAICPNLHWREAPGASPDDAAAATRARGGVPDARLVGDVGGAAEFLRGQATTRSSTSIPPCMRWPTIQSTSTSPLPRWDRLPGLRSSSPPNRPGRW